MSIVKEYLDYLRKKYETVDFIKNDTVQFLYSFKRDVKNLEIWGFIVKWYLVWEKVTAGFRIFNNK